MDIDVDPQAVKSAFDVIKSAVETIKTVRDAFSRKGSQDPQLDKQIVMAERELGLAEAQLAHALGYPLCRAHFPPLPMLLARVDRRTTESVFKCPNCGLEDPSPEKLSQLHAFLDS